MNTEFNIVALFISGFFAFIGGCAQFISGFFAFIGGYVQFISGFKSFIGGSPLLSSND
ncbi:MULTISPECIES: hypothetical protein [Allobacillus]|uniref:hypothetical protein n=1 Tax=Allobacillus TaxID=1400133 RepID=UPI001642350C|nr:hypothetical protein [Allobacillus salarius]